MSSTQYLTDAATRHQVFLKRYAGGQSKEAVAELLRLRRNINARLMQEPTLFRRERLVAVLDDIDALATEAFGTISRQTLAGVNNLARTEAGFSVGLFTRATTVTADFVLPADATLVAAVMSRPMPVTINTAIQVQDALAQFGIKKSKKIALMISDGVTLGETTPEIARSVGNLIDNLNRRQLDTLTRTITNHTASVARNVVYEENEDIIEGYQWIATLDSKTTMICGSRDKVIYDPKQAGSPFPPAHWGCRSTTIPIIKPEYDIGAGQPKMRPAKGAKGAGRVSGKSNYGGWLKKQPTAFVDEALGVERSRLFRSGKLTIDRFVDPTGRVYTLSQLEDMNPFAFM